jgi:DNA-binding LytR/AlgR family response regulator
VDAFDIDAVDYLIKPFSKERFIKAINKVREMVLIRREHFSEKIEMEVHQDCFFVKDRNTFIKIAYDDVLYIQSLGDFSYIFLQNGEKKIVLAALKSFNQQLPEKYFVRISRTHLVNIKKITSLDHEIAQIGKIQLTMGKTYYEDALKKILGNGLIKRFVS